MLFGLPSQAEPAADDSGPLGWLTNFLSFGTAWCQGFLEGGLVAFLTLFLEWRGFGEDWAAILLGVTTVGVILFQLPVSWLADRYGKTPVLLACYAVVVLGLIAVPLLTNLITLALVLFIFGGCSGAMYPLGLSMLADRIRSSSLVRAYAWYLIVECVGCLAGAATVGKARQLWGETSMFVIDLVAVLAVLLLTGAMHWLRDAGYRESSKGGSRANLNR